MTASSSDETLKYLTSCKLILCMVYYIGENFPAAQTEACERQTG